MNPNPVLKKLGFSPTDRLVILHTDDIGMCQASVQAYADLWEFGGISSGAIMLLDVQPASVDLGFRLFLTIPPIIGFLLAILALYFYPLHGKRLKEVKTALEAKTQK